ncbi:hypothetical protein [Embleya sp. NPDC001921]
MNQRKRPTLVGRVDFLAFLAVLVFGLLLTLRGIDTQSLSTTTVALAGLFQAWHTSRTRDRDVDHDRSSSRGIATSSSTGDEGGGNVRETPPR